MDNESKVKVLVVIITKDIVEEECLESVLNQDYPKDLRNIMIHVREPRVKKVEDSRFDESFNEVIMKYINCAANREIARKLALASDADKFLFVDSDVILPSHTISELVKQPFDVIGGWYKTKTDEFYTCGRWIGDNIFINLQSVETSVVKVDMIGMGCAMFSRKALTEIYFHHGTDMWAITYINGQEANLLFGECLALGNLLHDKGYQLYMDGYVVCTQVKRKEQRSLEYAI